MLNVKLYNLLGFSHNKLIQYPAAAPTPNTSPVLRRPRSGKALGRLRGERRKFVREFSPVLRDVSHDVGGLHVVGRIPQFSQLLSEPGEVSLEDRLDGKC